MKILFLLLLLLLVMMRMMMIEDDDLPPVPSPPQLSPLYPLLPLPPTHPLPCLRKICLGSSLRCHVLSENSSDKLIKSCPKIMLKKLQQTSLKLFSSTWKSQINQSVDLTDLMAVRIY